MQEKFIQIPAYINWYRLQYVSSHKISYLEYGDSSNPNVIICAHGLTRNAHDFHKIATVLSKNFRVISLSYPGRHLSEHLKNNKYYNYGVYIKDSLLLLKQLKIDKTSWIGTSMGGIIGMVLASKYPKVISSLIINDIGPYIPTGPLIKITEYAKKPPVFDDFASAKQYLKLIYSQFGIDDEEDWDYATKHSFVRHDGGKYIMFYDPAIIDNVSPKKRKPVDIWRIWSKINCKLLLVHGVKSNILEQTTVDKMKETKEMDIYRVEYAGHAPSLMTYDQISYIEGWLLQNNVVSDLK